MTKRATELSELSAQAIALMAPRLYEGEVHVVVAFGDPSATHASVTGADNCHDRSLVVSALRLLADSMERSPLEYTRTATTVTGQRPGAVELTVLPSVAT